MSGQVSQQQRNAAIAFVKKWAELSGGSSTLDEDWWMALEEMLAGGWFAGHGTLQELPALSDRDLMRLVVALTEKGILPPLEPYGVLIAVEGLGEMQGDGYRFILPAEVGTT